MLLPVGFISLTENMLTQEVSTFVKIFPFSRGGRILYSTLTGATALIQEDFPERLRNEKLTIEEKQNLIEMGILINNIDNEKQDILNLFDQWNQKKKTLNVIAVMNLTCNLKCIYCYEGDRKNTDTHMSKETVDNLITFLSKRLDGNEKLYIDFYGGEPLLSLPLIRGISERMLKIAERKGIQYQFSLVTNGTLLSPAVVDSLIPLGLKSLKVTIDGPCEIHDLQRPRISGAGSFHTIVENLMDAYRKIQVQIGGNFFWDNYRRFPELLDYLLEYGLDPKELLAVKFDPIAETEGKNVISDFGKGCRSINEPWLSEASVFLREEILKRGFSTPQVKLSPCMILFEKEYVVNYDGVIYKCPGFICHKDYIIGNVKEEDPVVPHIYKPNLWKNTKCMDCGYLPLCFGGCRYMEFVRTGRIDNVDCRYDYFEATLGAFIDQEVRYDSGQ